MERELARRREAWEDEGADLPGDYVPYGADYERGLQQLDALAPRDEPEEIPYSVKKPMRENTGRLTLNEMNEMRRIAGLPLLKND